MNKTTISWTDMTWNPLLGCRRVSPGCGTGKAGGCYAERLVGVRMSKNPKLPLYHDLARVTDAGLPQWTGAHRLVTSRLDEPLRVRKPQRIFVNDMGDTFFEGHSFEEIAAVFGVMAAADNHTFQVLTKRDERMAKFFEWVEKRAEDGKSLFPDDSREWRIWQMLYHYARKAGGARVRPHHGGAWPLPNVWLGVSVEDKPRKSRIDVLRKIPAAVRFLSVEPLLEDLGDLDLTGIDQVIVGGESGPNARPFDLAWASSIIAQCRRAGVAPFMKQLGSNPQPRRVPMPEAGRDAYILETLRIRDRAGADPSEWPEEFRVQEMPNVGPAVAA